MNIICKQEIMQKGWRQSKYDYAYNIFFYIFSYHFSVILKYNSDFIKGYMISYTQDW